MMHVCKLTFTRWAQKETSCLSSAYKQMTTRMCKHTQVQTESGIIITWCADEEAKCTSSACGVLNCL